MATVTPRIALKGRLHRLERLSPWLGAAWSRGASVGIMAALHLWLASVMGAGEYGGYLFLMSLALATASISLRGHDTIALRWTARSRELGDQNAEDSVLGYCRRQTLIAGLACGAVLLLISAVAPRLNHFATPAGCATAALIAALCCTLRVTEAAYRGQGRPTVGSLSTWVVPAVSLATLATFSAFAEESPTAHLALRVHAAVQAGLLAGFCLIGSARLLRGQLSRGSHSEQRDWSLESRRLTLLSIAGSAQTHGMVLLLGVLLSTEAVGQFGVAVKLAGLTLLGIEAVNLVSSPRFARAHADHDTALLQRHASQSVKLSFGAAVAILAVLAIAYPSMLRWVGADYTPTAAPLVVLAAASLFNAGCGSVAVILNMTGKSHLCLQALFVSAALGVAVSLVAIPLGGVLGAAAGQASSIACWNLILVYKARSVLGLRTDIVSALFAGNADAGVEEPRSVARRREAA